MNFNMASNSNSMFVPCLVLAVMVISAGNVGASYYDIYSLQDPCSAGREYYLATSSGALVQSQLGAVYSDGQRCTIIISTSDNYKLFVTSETISVEEGLDCIILYDGPDTSGPEALRHCSSSDLQFTSSQKYLTISFDTDGSINYSGFTLAVTPVRANDLGFNCAYDINYFSCVTSGNCIDSGFESDGHQNCPDSSDEPFVDCTANLYYDTESCQDRTGCYSTYEHCDGNTDCSDGSDETNCDCTANSYSTESCQDKTGCYSSYEHCNGNTDCSDGSDETNCDECRYTFYYCSADRLCIRNSQVCDDFPDCPNGQDEDEPECHPSVYTYWSSGQLAGLFIGYIIFAAIVIAIVVVVHKNCKKRSG